MICGIAVISASAAFALELPDALQFPGLTVSGDVRTGLRVEGATYDKFGEHDEFKGVREAGAEDAKAYAYSDDIDDGTPFRAQLVLQWERDNLGVKTRFRYRPDADPDGEPGDGRLNAKVNDLNNTVNKAFVWGSMLDNKVKVTLGKGLDAGYSLFYSNFNGTGAKVSKNVGDFDGKDGVRLDVTPIEGLSIGLFYGTGDLFANAYKNGDSSDFTDWASSDRRFVVGAKYTTDNIKIVASLYHNFYNWEHETDALGKRMYSGGPFFGGEDEAAQAGFSGGKYFSGDQFDNWDSALPNTSNLLVGAQYAADALQIDLSLAFVNLGSMKFKDNFSYNNFDQKSTTTEEEFDAGLENNIYKGGNFNPFWAFKPKISVAYALNDQLTVALALTDLTIGDLYWYEKVKEDGTGGAGNLFPITINPSAAYAINDDITASLDLNFKINADATDQFGFGVKPAAEFSLGSGATFVVYDEITFWTQSKDDAALIAEHGGKGVYEGRAHNGASGTTNTLQFDFVWTF
jgi:hypothetical protein